MVRGGGRPKVRARLCRWHSGVECLPPRPSTRHLRAGALPLQRKLPSSSDRLSKVAAAPPRCVAEADSRCVLVSAAGTPVESACRHDHAPDTCCKRFDFATEAAIKLRLIEQACGCSTVRGGDRPKVRARLCLWRVRACRQDQPPAPAGAFAFATEAAMNLRLIEQACGCSTV